MILREPVPELDISNLPQSPLSVRNPLAYILLIGWSFWSPKTIIEYGENLVRTYGEEFFPESIEPSTWRNWWRGNRRQRDFALLAAITTCLALTSVVILNIVQKVLLNIAARDTIVAETMFLLCFYSLLAFGVGGLVLLFTGNIGSIVFVALPFSSMFALSIISVGHIGYLDLLPARPSLASFTICLIWGFATGIAANFVYHIWLEASRARLIAPVWLFLVIYCVAVALLAAKILPLYGVTLEALQEKNFAEFWRAMSPIIGFAAGTLLGFLRPMEWLGAQFTSGTLTSGRYVWGIPRMTPLPIGRIERQLRTWLRSDWRRGLGNADAVWQHTFQQPTAQRSVHKTLNQVEDSRKLQSEMELLDLDVVGSWQTVRPSRPKSGSSGAAAQSVTPTNTPPKNSRAYDQQVELEKVLRRPRVAPSFAVDDVLHASSAALWYYARGYWPETLEALRSCPKSPLVAEYEALAKAFQQLYDLDDLARQANLKLAVPRGGVIRQTPWDLLDEFCIVTQDCWRYQQCSDPVRKRICLADAEARLRSILGRMKSSSLLERRTITVLADRWLKNIKTWKNA